MYFIKSFSNFSLENSSSTARLLLFMAIPGHLTFALIIWQLAADHAQPSFVFIFLYLITALIQVKYFRFFFINKIKFILIVFIGSDSSLYCSMDGCFRLATTSRSR